MPHLLFDLFKRSPFGPLIEHMAKVSQCIALLEPLFDAILSNADEDKIKVVFKQIIEAEHQADIIKNEIRRSLPGRIFLPVNREDLLAYLKMQDNIADAIEDVAVLLTLKKLTIHESLHERTRQFLEKVLAVCHLCEEAVREFEDLVESAFGEAKRQKLNDIVGRMEHAEWEADKSQTKAARRLFELENEISAVDIFLIFRIFGELGDVANHANKTGDLLRRLILKG
jgi:predicted phosphate transport protein (TIGR00153 family)